MVLWNCHSEEPAGDEESRIALKMLRSRFSLALCRNMTCKSFEFIESIPMRHVMFLPYHGQSHGVQCSEMTTLGRFFRSL